MKRKIFALFLALTLTFQLVTPVFADTEEAETTAATEAVLETEAPTEAPAESPATDAAVPPTETEPTETAAATTAPATTEPTQAVETTAPTETAEVTEETTAPTEETLSLLDEGVLSGECGANLTWTLDESTGTLTISGTGAMRDYGVTASGETTAPWRDLSFTTLVLEPGITRIGRCAFYQEYDISCDLTIPEGVTAIGYNAFRCCSIWELTLPDSLKTIESGAFTFTGNCAIRIPAGVTTIGENSLAGDARSAITVDPANRSFKMIGNGLYNASGTRLLAVIQGDGTFTIPDTVSQVDSSTFNNCDYTEIHLGAKVPAQFSAYVSPFSSANNLKSITVSASNPNYKAVDGVLFSKDGKKLISYPCQKAGASYTVPDGVETILQCAFEGNDYLTELILPEGVKTIDYWAAIECPNLTSVTLPASLRTLEYRAIGYSWDGDTNSNLTIRGYTGSAAESYALENGFLFESIGEISETASGTCGKNLKWKLMGTTLTISGTGAMTNYALSYNNTTGQESTNAPWFGLEYTSLELESGITTIGDYAFYLSDLGGSVIVPEGVTAIGKYAFSGCYKISNLSLPSTLKTIGEWAASSLFACDTLHIPAGVASIGDDAFSGMAWDEITVDPENRAFRVVDGGLYNAAGNRLLAVENGTGKFTVPDTVAKIDTYAFWNCDYSAIHLGAKIPGGFEANPTLTETRNLEAITVSKSNPNLKAEDGVLFSADGKRLIHYPREKQGESYTIPAGVEVLGSGAFHENSCLTSLTLPEGLKEINYEAIFWCDNLKSITIPASVTKLEWRAVGYTENDEWDVVPMTDFTIYGYGDGAAKTYAEENGFRYVDLDIRSGECGENLTWSLNKGLLTISGEGTMRDFSPENPAPWQDSAAAIKTVDIKKDVASIGSDAFRGCTSLKEVYYGGSKTEWKELDIGDGNECLTQATIHYGCGTDAVSTEIRPVETDCLTSGSKLTLTAWMLPDGKKVKAKWSLASGDEAYASISSSGVLTAKNVNEVQNITVIATPTDGSPEARKEIQILPKITVKQAEKFNLFHNYSRAELAITGGKVDCALLDGNKDFVLENENDHFYIRFADPDNPPAKPNTKATLQVFFPGSDTPATKTLTISTTNTAPKLKLNPTSSILNTTLIDGLTVEAEVLGTEDESLKARSATSGVTASIESGKLVVTLDTAKTTTATIYLKGNDWAKEVKLTHKITVTDKKPTVKFTAKGKLDVLNPASEIVYTPKLTNAAGTITDVQLEGTDADLFQADVTDGIIHLKLAKSGEEYSTKKTYKVTPKVTLYDTPIDCSPVSLKVTQSALKLAKIPNQAVYQTQTAPLAVKLAVTSPANAKIGDVQLNAKTTVALRTALETAGGINFEADTVTFPASTFATLKPGKYTVILDVTPANAAGDTKPIQAKFTLTVQK